MRSLLLPVCCLSAALWAQSAEENALHAPEKSDSSASSVAAEVPASSERVLTAAPAETVHAVQQVRGLKLGFVNFRRIMLEIPQFTDMRATLENEFRADNTRLINEREKLVSMEAELARMERNDAYIAFEKQVIAKRREVARQEAAFRDSYSVRRNEEMAKLQTVVADEIVRLAKEDGFDVILNDIGVVYVSEEADLTSTVILRLETRNR